MTNQGVAKFMVATVIVLTVVTAVLTVAVVRQNDPHLQAERLAASVGVTLKWDDSPCGSKTQSACYLYAQPDTIYINPNGDVDYWTRRSIAQVIEHRAGIGDDECQAIKIARALGTNAYPC